MLKKLLVRYYVGADQLVAIGVCSSTHERLS